MKIQFENFQSEAFPTLTVIYVKIKVHKVIKILIGNQWLCTNLIVDLHFNYRLRVEFKRHPFNLQPNQSTPVVGFEISM